MRTSAPTSDATVFAPDTLVCYDGAMHAPCGGTVLMGVVNAGTIKLDLRGANSRKAGIVLPKSDM